MKIKKEKNKTRDSSQTQKLANTRTQFNAYTQY